MAGSDQGGPRDNRGTGMANALFRHYLKLDLPPSTCYSYSQATPLPKGARNLGKTKLKKISICPCRADQGLLV